ncbi:N-acetyllactosaminide beta-1,3-N-acetylglucosaminyltransferase 3-like isoform X2 [Cololabis saira]|uniref:N-acetyllactosaminide beta-1,3-N-acetylglucosaminyltransferase 3-like isoform X2 n=1 Tax=Cololabis saira TaxID=129043 RepID=UPI002AD444B1|nr:N-acetyllactosaminide beta-1,3-N-acetylglucosaminyltransferase 3-like isoform X2 [Cololabis saira]
MALRKRILPQTLLVTVVLMVVYICINKDSKESNVLRLHFGVAREVAAGSAPPPASPPSTAFSAATSAAFSAAFSTAFSPTGRPMPRCDRNTSVTNVTDFNSLPGHLKDFLYYRHCRYFPMLLDTPGKCGGADRSGDVFLLLVVKSSPGNYDRREVLRKTWAAERLHNGVWIRRVFISGTSGAGFQKERLNKLLEMEQREYSDILQWDFSDTFYNLTLKQILFLEWMERNCPNARFLLNGDDDVLSNTDNMVTYLQSLRDNVGSKHLFTGHIIPNAKVIRFSSSKYYVPVQVQESESYPPYCGGGGFLLSGYTAMVIYRMSWDVLFHPIDDVYMGMCLAKAGLAPSFHHGVKVLGINLLTIKLPHHEACFLKELLLVHRVLPPQMFLLWKQIHDPHLNCERE